MRGHLDVISKYLTLASAAAASVSIFLMMWMITFNVLMRYIFNKPLAFVEEYSSFTFVFAVFMGLGYVTRNNMHINIELIHRHLSLKTKLVLNLCTSSASLLVLCVYLYFALSIFFLSFGLKDFSIITYTPLWIPKAFIALGLSFFILEVINVLLKSVDAIADEKDKSITS